MPYSADKHQNANNPYTPSPMLLDDQFLYRFAQLETVVREGFKRVDEKLDVMAKDIHESKVETTAEIVELKTKVQVLEKWQNAMTVRFSLILAVVITFWTVFGPAIRGALGIGNG